MTEWQALPAMAPRLANPVQPKGALLDEFGQSALLEWPGKTRGEEELTQRIRGQRDAAEKQSWPEEFEALPEAVL